MLLEDALSKISPCRYQELNDKTVFQVITDEEFYFAPNLMLDDKYSKIDNGNSKFIIFSSPGAVGKTALAKYIAKKYNAYYWNVAQKPINGTSFMGELAHAIGIGQGRSSLQDTFISAMNEGRTLVVLDSFDEAELISRWDGVEAFIVEIGNILQTPEIPTVILTARTEMANRLCALCEKNGFGIERYNIDYFEVGDAKRFIESYLEFQNIDINDSDKAAIDSYLEEIKKRVAASYKDDDIKEFIGYAQVLRILSVQIEKLINDSADLSKALSIKSHESSRFVYDVIQGLIEREQSKLEVFKKSIRCKYSADMKSIIDAMYCKEEQLARLSFFVLYGNADEIRLDDYGKYNSLYEEDKQEYLRLLKDWLPQHVFLKGNKIMPVFSDYLFAESLLKPELSLFRDEYEQCKKLPTRVFLDCYLQLNNNCVNANDIYFIDSAYISQVSEKNKFFCEIGYIDSDKQDELYLSYSDMKNIQTSGNKISMKINHEKDEAIRLNRVENMSVNIKGILELATGFMQDVLVRQSSLECDTLKLLAKEIVFETYDQEENVLIVHESVSRSHDSKITFRGTKKLKADLPLEKHPNLRGIMHEFEGCFYSFDNDDNMNDGLDDIISFAYGLKKVLEQFKVDKYEGDPAKHKSKIASRCTTGVNKRVLDFLLEEKAIYEDKHLYKYNKVIMNELQINRTAYTHFNKKSHQAQLEFAYAKYKKWLRKVFA